jgi:glutamine amidotransferase
MIAIVDYKAGNLTSVKNAFDAIGADTVVTRDPDAILRAERVVFPGVGAAKSAMENLGSLGLVDVVRRAAESKPFLGICLGMQILFEHTEEDGGVDLLGILPGRVRRFPEGADKVPQIGWNDVVADDPREFVKSGEEYYFVHSYYVEKNPCTVAVSSYAGLEFTAAVRRGDLFATQFHPEKSGKLGLQLLRAFLNTPADGRRQSC